MTKANVLVTGVGGGIGQSILKSLEGTDYSAIAADADPLAAGLYAATRAYRIPRADSPEFLPRVMEICCQEKCALIFPGIEPELPVLARASEQLRAAGVTAVVSSPQVVEIADDKLLTARFLAENGFAAPITLPLAEACGSMHLPLVLKPRRGGARSKGVYVVRTEQELRFRCATIDAANYIAQEYLGGDEFTCGTINFEGRCHGVIVMRRTLRDGDTYKAFVEPDGNIGEHVRAVAEKLVPFGPCNFQLRMKHGGPCIFEINARCSGTTYCRALAGFNEPLMTAEFLLKKKTPKFKIREMSFLRYWKELVVPNQRICEMESRGTVAGDGGKL
jgi:carbamoyl-phosphate synthase large subunit